MLFPEVRRRRQQRRLLRCLRYNIVRACAYYTNRYGGFLTADLQVNEAALSRLFKVGGRSGPLPRPDLPLPAAGA